MIIPGTLVKVTVVRRLENGLIVQFMKIFVGYIFDDHAGEEKVEKGARFMAR